MSKTLISPLGADSLDIDKIRESFKSYLLENGVIKDVNYLGSTGSLLVDIISYAIQSINNTNAMVHNQTILTLSDIRENIIEISKQLGYNITRVISSKMSINVTYPLAQGYSITIPAYTNWTSGNFNFMNTEDILLTKTNNSVNFEVKEGTLINSDVDSRMHEIISSDKFKFILNYKNIENDSIKMYVKKSGNTVFNDTWTKVNSLTELRKDKNYFYEEYDSSTGWVIIHTSYAGNGYIFGSGDEVKFEFIISNGTKTNGLASIELKDKVYDNANNEVVLTVSPNTESRSGQDEESTQNIKDNAPKFYNTGGRAVNEYDYEAFLEQSSLIGSAIAWGGEVMPIKQLGHIYVSAIPQDVNFNYFNDNDIVSILEILKNSRIVSTIRVFLQPVYVYVDFAIKVLGIVPNIITRQNSINAELTKYFNNIDTFKSSFYESKITKIIEDVFIDDKQASVTINLKPKLNLTQELFNDNLIYDNLTLPLFIPDSSERYYLKKGTERIPIPEDDRDLVSYYENGWTKVYEPDEDLILTFDTDNINNDVNLSIVTINNELFFDDGTSQLKIGYFDTINSILYLYRKHFDNSIIRFDYVFNNITPNVGDIITTSEGATGEVLEVNKNGKCVQNVADIVFDSVTLTISSTTTDLSIFSDGDTIIISDSTSNDGVYTVTGIPTTTSLTVVETLVNETAGASVSIVTKGNITVKVISGTFLQGNLFDIGNTYTAGLNNISITDITLNEIDLNLTKFLKINYSPYFNTVFKHNTTIKLGDITYV